MFRLKFQEGSLADSPTRQEHTVGLAPPYGTIIYIIHRDSPSTNRPLCRQLKIAFLAIILGHF